MSRRGLTGRLARLPLSARMAALTTGALIALVVLVGVFVQRQFGIAQRHDIDRELIDVARIAAKAVENVRSQDLSQLLRSGVGGPAGEPAASGFQVQVVSATGSVLAASEGVAGADGLVRGGELVRVATGVAVYGDATVDQRTHRFVGVSVEDGSGRIVAVATPIQDVAEAERTLLAAYIPAALAAAVVAAIAGWWIAKRSLAPLRDFAAESEAIGALDLSQRLSVPPTTDEIGRLGVTLNRMLDRLDAAWQRERQLTAKVGHELRTPLAIMRAELELLLDGVREEEMRSAVESVLEEVDRTSGVIEDVLLLARADADVVLDLPEPVDLGTLAQRASERFAALASGKGVELRAWGEARTEGDRHALERALANLIDNALRHAPKGGAVEIVVEQQNDSALLVVRDTGPGVPENVLGRMFDRYARAGPQRGAAGLGLSIVAAVAASHQGSVSARNRPEGGLEVTLELR